MKTWNPDLNELLALLYPDHSAADLSQVLGVSKGSIYMQAQLLGVSKDPAWVAEKSRQDTLARSPFTPDIVKLIHARYADTPTPELAAQTGLTDKQIHAYAKRKDLKKSKACKSEMQRRLQLARPEMYRKGYSQKGSVPANKGMRGVSYPGSKATQFKPGQRPYTWVPIGSLRVNGDGYLDRKVRDQSPSHKNWEAVHRLAWIEANGPIPKGHMVVFKPGMRTTALEEITLDRLELRSRADHARINHWKNKSPDLKALVPLKSLLTRGINRAQRRLKEDHEQQQAA